MNHRHVPNTEHTSNHTYPACSYLKIHLDKRFSSLVLDSFTKMYSSDDGKHAAFSRNCSYRLLGLKVIALV